VLDTNALVGMLEASPRAVGLTFESLLQMGGRSMQEREVVCVAMHTVLAELDGLKQARASLRVVANEFFRSKQDAWMTAGVLSLLPYEAGELAVRQRGALIAVPGIDGSDRVILSVARMVAAALLEQPRVHPVLLTGDEHMLSAARGLGLSAVRWRDMDSLLATLHTSGGHRGPLRLLDVLDAVERCGGRVADPDTAAKMLQLPAGPQQGLMSALQAVRDARMRLDVVQRAAGAASPAAAVALLRDAEHEKSVASILRDLDVADSVLRETISASMLAIQPPRG
jgi:hypothetical protein